MMSIEDRECAIANIQKTVPEEVFNSFVCVLPRVEESNNDALVSALNKIINNNKHTFMYRMNTGDNETTITPIREILDLFEGWFITSKSRQIADGKIVWDVKSIYSD